MQNPAILNGTYGRRILRTSITVAAVGVVSFGWLIGVAAHGVSNGELAAAIRASGNPCARVIEKERLSEGSSVWRVRCNSGRFQVTMKADSAPEVVPID
ncbi:MAG: hypothetical protein E2O75_00585 [Chloroflexi bacterium]|jgi:hypothetical protein|nr:MAG: hypothetical protein E2O75_00585 [Chloroflexota bacterium]